MEGAAIVTSPRAEAQRAIAASLGSAFDARRVALIGASERIHYHHAVVANLRSLGFSLERLALVNPNRTSVFGLPCYPSVEDVPGPIDLAMLAITAERVPEIVQACALRHVPGVVIVSAGFAEAGPEGRERQAALTKLAADHGIAVLGPNSLGLVRVRTGLGLFASALPQGLRSGNVSAIFQSGGMLNLFLGLLGQHRIGLASAVVTGNEAVVTLTDLLERAVEDPETGVIALYLESVGEPARFRAALAEAEAAGKPVVALRAGVSSRGQRNVATHSGNLATGSAAWSALLHQRNVVVVGNIDELLEATAVLSCAEQLGTRPTRPRAALMSVSGGDCTLLSDIAERTGWELPDLPSHAHDRLVEAVGKLTLADNPLDVGGLWRRGLISTVAKIVCADADVDVVAFRLNLPNDPADELLEAYRTLATTIRRSGKLPVALTRASERLEEHWYPFFADLDVPFLHEYERALRSVRRLVDYYRRRDTRRARQPEAEGGGVVPTPDVLAWFRGLRPGPLTYLEVKRLLEAFGFSFPRGGLARTAEEAVALAEAIGYPVAVKVDSRRIMHRTEIGGVRLNLRDAAQVREAHASVQAAAGRALDGAAAEGVIVQEMVQGVAEVIVGISIDPQVGPTLLLGAGGIFAEVLNDVALCPVPVSAMDVDEMLGSLRSLPLLSGARGRPRADLESVRRAALGVSRLACQLGPYLGGLDLNPLLVLADGHGARVVDALVIRSEVQE